MTDQIKDDSDEQISLFQVPSKRLIVDSPLSDRLLAREPTESGKRLRKPKPLQHRQISAKACSGTLKRQPKDPNNYLMCLRCGQVVSRGLVEAKGFTLPTK